MTSEEIQQSTEPTSQGAGTEAAAEPAARENESAPTARSEGSSSRSGLLGAAEEDGSSDSPYDFVVDLETDNTHASIVHMVGFSRRVLELGPASGYMSRVFRERDCTVVGIELDPQLAAQAAGVCERVIVGNLDDLDIETELAGERFDVIVAADVLEHLKDPLDALRRLRPLLTDEGYFVVSLPNIAHASVRLSLLQGHFEYRDLGLMDRTHLRFFTRETVRQLFDDAEMAIVAVHRQEAPVFVDDVTVDREAVPAELIAALEADPEARTYQFVIKAISLDTPGLRDIQDHLREQAFEIARLEGELAQLASVNELERVLVELTRREGEVRGALVDAHDLALQRDEELREVSERLAHEQEQLAQLWSAHNEAKEIIRARDDEAERLRVRLQRISGSAPVRAWYKISGLPVLRQVRGRRAAAYEAAVQPPNESRG